MAKKHKGSNNSNNNKFSAPPITLSPGKQQINGQKPAIQEITSVTVADVKNSSSESEFNRKKEELIEAMITEITGLEQEKDSIKIAINTTRKLLEEVEIEYKELQIKKYATQTDLNTANKELTSAEKACAAAGEEAKSILEGAEKEKLELIAKAADEARDAWKQHAESLSLQFKELAGREQTMQRAQLQIEKDKRDLEIQLEDLSDMKAFVTHQKDKYSKASPEKIEELSCDLSEMSEKYKYLRNKYDEQTKKYVELQTVLDSIKAEIHDSNDGKNSISVNGLIMALKELKEKHDSLVLLHERYPNDDSIRPLEKAATEYNALLTAFEALEYDRNRFREQAKAATRTQKELETIKQEVDATHALNEHLLKELESHKTALESRTGDTCPSLTKVDAETEDADFVREIADRNRRTPLKSLSDIVSQVKHYAGSRKKEEKLYYTDDDIRAFLAGMAVSRLIILQGMSGTGKSSLPRIFSEAISGFNRLIPVESSWRDRNELLGYYNDFNKKFNAKSFTIELYRSGKKRCAEIPTFIVLDEMNLARIEYYFSDFLAILQEPDKDKWLIELVSSDMRTLPMELPEEVKDKMRRDSTTIFAIWEKIEKSRKGELSTETTDDEKIKLSAYLDKLGKLTGAKDLIDGRKIRVTENIWFIGTANKDESTFEISDKVYDRAQIISFNKKGIPEKKYEDREMMYISAASLIQMFENAINKNNLKADVTERLEELDKLLIDKFDVSFGNRIVRHTIDFSAVFVAAGGKLDTALDYQISAKILRKVITSDDGEALLELQAQTMNYPQTNNAIKKRIKELK